MADITIQQKVDLLEFYFTNGKNIAAVVRQMKTK